MPITEQLLQIFIDQLVASLVVPMRSAYILDVIENLNPEIYLIGLVLAWLGSIIGGVFSYIIGYLLANGFFNFDKKNLDPKKYQKLHYFMLLVPLNYFGGVITFFAGFGHMNKRKFVLYLIAINSVFFIAKAIIYLVK